jgi:hypothetical protein
VRGWRPPLLQRHTGNHMPGLPRTEAWPTEFDIEVARRKVRRFLVIDPVAVRQPVSWTQLVLLYEQQHEAAVIFAAALDRERAR